MMMAIVTVTYAKVQDGRIVGAYAERNVEIDDCDMVEAENNPAAMFEIPDDLAGCEVIGAEAKS